jgi:hypothetical protein
MAKYFVRMPIVGIASAEVEADSEQEAIEKMSGLNWNVKVESEDGIEIDELDLLDRVSRGNVLYAPLNEACAEEMEDDD